MPVKVSRQRDRLLRIAALALSLSVLGLAEGALRLADYGGNLRLFVTSPDDDRYLMPNPRVIDRYFAAGMAPALTIEPNYFLRDKPAGGIRIFVQGGSTAAGFPYGESAAIAQLLGARLRQSFPGRPVEVVDTAMSAVTSYVLLDLADEIIAGQPDAVVIYAGHNEFLGVFGVGSVYAGTGSQTLTRMALWLHRLRLYRLVRDLGLQARRLIDEPVTTDATTLMAVIAREREIPLDSDLYRRGIAQYRSNLAALVDRYTAAGIPVLLGTVVSNLKDQPPFLSTRLPDAVTDELRATLALIDSGRADTLSDASVGRLEQLAADFGSADLYFAAGAAHAARGNLIEAHGDYALARDYDLLRFRASADINEAIRRTAASTTAQLVDVEDAFARASADGLPGHELILEHLHPNADGYFLLADTFYRALAAAAIPEPLPRFVTTAQAQAELAIFPAERWYGRAAVAQLAADFPFVPTPRPPELPPVRSAADALGRAWFDNEISWHELAEASRDLAADPLQRALASQRIADALPFRDDLALRAASDWLAAGRPDDAARYSRR